MLLWGSRQRPRYFCLYSILFLKLWVCVLYMLLWLFANMFLIMFYAISKLNWISGSVLYTVVNGNRLCSAWRKRRRPIFAFRYWNIEFYRRGDLFFRGKTGLVLRGEGKEGKKNLDANVLVLIDTDQSIFVNGRFSLSSDIHRPIVYAKHR